MTSIPLPDKLLLLIWRNDQPHSQVCEQLAGHLELLTWALLELHPSGVVWVPEYHSAHARRSGVQIFSVVNYLAQFLCMFVTWYNRSIPSSTIHVYTTIAWV